MIARKRVLFVDDAPSSLDGIENLLHEDRKRWDMVLRSAARPRSTIDLASLGRAGRSERVPGWLAIAERGRGGAGLNGSRRRGRCDQSTDGNFAGDLAAARAGTGARR